LNLLQASFSPVSDRRRLIFAFLENKLGLPVKKHGMAWRGYMPREEENAHGNMDHRDGIYFGPDHPYDHPTAGRPLVRLLEPFWRLSPLMGIPSSQEPTPG